VSQYQKGKTDLDFTEAKDSEWQGHQLDHMQVCNSLQTDNHASTPPLKFFTGRIPFLPPKQLRQGTEETDTVRHTTQLYILIFMESCSGVLDFGFWRFWWKFAPSHYFGYWLLQQLVLPYKPRSY